MERTLVFDMDGTLADLYNVENWLEMLRAENPMPYIMAQPMYDMEELVELLEELKEVGWRIAVTSWLSMNFIIWEIVLFKPSSFCHSYHFIIFSCTIHG